MRSFVSFTRTKELKNGVKFPRLWKNNTESKVETANNAENDIITISNKELKRKNGQLKKKSNSLHFMLSMAIDGHIFQNSSQAGLKTVSKICFTPS